MSRVRTNQGQRLSAWWAHQLMGGGAHLHTCTQPSCWGTQFLYLSNPPSVNILPILPWSHLSGLLRSKKRLSPWCFLKLLGVTSSCLQWLVVWPMCLTRGCSCVDVTYQLSARASKYGLHYVHHTMGKLIIWVTWSWRGQIDIRITLPNCTLVHILYTLF